MIEYLINARRPNEHLGLAVEKIYPWVEQCLDDIIRLMSEQMRGHFPPGKFERGGNTKTHSLVRATVTVPDDVPERMCKGVFARQRSYPAWIRFSVPGPDVPKDIQDVVSGSMAIKLMDVPGPQAYGR